MKCLIFLLFFISLKIEAKDLSVLSWNTFLVPSLFNSSKQVERSELMAQKLRTLNHDILFFQEAFLETQRDLLIKELAPAYPFFAVSKKGQGFFQLVGPGLFIMSKYPMKVLDQIVFDDCSGTDCLASKSAIIVEVSLSKNKTIQMIDTHLQGWDKSEIRKKQLLQIKNLMKSNSRPGVAQVLVGDLNIDGNLESEYSDSLVLMNMTSTPLGGRLDSSNGFSTVGCFETPGGISKGEWLDHLWLNPNGSQTEIHSKKIVPITGRLGAFDCPLSDHHAIEALINVKIPSKGATKLFALAKANTQVN